MSRGRMALFGALAAAVAGLDLATKAWAFARITDERGVAVIRGFFYLRLSMNQGGVFGVGQGRVWFFVVFSVLAMAFILWMFWTQGRESRLLSSGLGVLMGGAVGNLYDRVALGHVRDFLDFRFWGWPFPTFNFADVGINVGVGLLILSALLVKPAPKGVAGGEAGPDHRRRKAERSAAGRG